MHVNPNHYKCSLICTTGKTLNEINKTEAQEPCTIAKYECTTLVVGFHPWMASSGYLWHTGLEMVEEVERNGPHCKKKGFFKHCLLYGNPKVRCNLWLKLSGFTVWKPKSSTFYHNFNLILIF